MENLKKLEDLLRSAAGKISAEAEASPEEQAVFATLNEALVPEDADHGEQRRQFFRFLGSRMAWAMMGAAAGALMCMVALPSGKDASREVLNAAYAAQERADLSTLFTITRNKLLPKTRFDPFLSVLVARAENPGDPLRTIETHLGRGDDRAALKAAAERLAVMMKEKGEGRLGEDAKMEELLRRYLLRHTDEKVVSMDIRGYALILIMRLFLENPADAPQEIADSEEFRERLESMLAECSQTAEQAELLSTISALSCSGTFKSAEKLAGLLEHTSPETEKRRLLLFSLERIYRRSFLCREVDDLGKGRGWLREIFREWVRNNGNNDKLARDRLKDVLSFEARLNHDEDRIRQEIGGKFQDNDELDPASHFSARFSEQELQEEKLTEKSSSPLGKGLLAAWDFSEARFAHQGSALPARGMLTNCYKEKHLNTGHLRLNVFGESKLILPFQVKEVPERGVQVKLRQLTASRLYFPFQGSALFTVLLDGKALAENVVVTRHSNDDWDGFWISREYFWQGEHEFTILLSDESTTTYWIYEVQIGSG